MFVSSCFGDGGDLVGTLRHELIRRLEKKHLRVWAWERFYERSQSFPSFETIDRYLAGLRHSRAVVVFVSRRRGTHVEPWNDGRSAYGTFFEIEIYFAVALGKPIYLFYEEGQQPPAAIRALINAARQSGSIAYEHELPREKVPAAASDAIGSLLRIRARPRVLHTVLALGRDPNIDFRTCVPFLLGATPPRSDADLGTAIELLREGSDPRYTIVQRMARLWLVIQALSSLRKDFRDAAIADLWIEALGSWASAASWLGLHAHLSVSPLIAHAERARMLSTSPNSTTTEIPYSAMASARYSIARRQLLRPRRYAEMEAAKADARRAILQDHDNVGAHSILGHACLQTFALGDARSSFAESLRIRESQGEAGSIGEGMCDLGFAQVLSLSASEGIALLQQGVALLETRQERGFYLRGLRKLELAYLLTGRFRAARQIGAKRVSLATAEAYLDQVSPHQV